MSPADVEVEYVAHGGILQYVLCQRAAQMKP
jgi:hypothetical protein